MAETIDFGQVVEDVRRFFTAEDHWAYHTTGTDSIISPTSVYHITQLEVLFEDKHFHDRTYRAIQQLREEGFLKIREFTVVGTRTTLVWKANLRYVERATNSHISMMAEYMSPIITKATGDYAETLVLMGLSRLHMDFIGKHTATYHDKKWTKTDHDLDLIMEKNGTAYGIEVKNTLDYFPDDELQTKLEMCKFLGIVPLFITRNRHAKQWQLTKSFNGLLYIFKSKIFPPGHTNLVERIWQQMRLPVAIWNDWPGQFYPTISKFVDGNIGKQSL